MVIDGSKYKATNNRDKNLTCATTKRRLAQIETSLVRYFDQLVQADHEESSVADTKTINLKDKIAALRGEMVPVIVIEIHMQNVPDNQVWHEVKGASV